MAVAGKEISIDIYDHYTKQTYRNRCNIMGANGIIRLSIPVIRKHGAKTYTRDIRIDYTEPWNHVHWRSIFSSYASAPFFEFMEDNFRIFYEKKWTFLVDLNMEILHVTMELLQWDKIFKTSSAYENELITSDARESVHPKRSFFHPTLQFTPEEYHQVFIDRHGFTPDLSILDLLFCEGPNASSILMKSIKKTAE